MARHDKEWTCWHCGRQFMYVRGERVYWQVKDPIGNIMRVHKQCLPEVLGNGYKEVTK